MLPGMELMACTDLAVPAEVMHHVVRVESSYNPYAIGVVGGRLVRQPANLAEAVATARMLEQRGYNFSLGLAQVNRYNLRKQGLDSYQEAFDACPNLAAGSRILADCHARAGGDWDKSFSCYYSGNFTTGFRHGYVRKIRASISASGGAGSKESSLAIGVVDGPKRRTAAATPAAATTGAAARGMAVMARRISAPASDPGLRGHAMPPSADREPEPAGAEGPEPYVPDVQVNWGAGERADARPPPATRDGAFVF